MPILRCEKTPSYKYQDVMVDIETLGQGPGCKILSIGAVAFNSDAKTIGPEFYQVFNTMNQGSYGLKTEKETVEWWAKQSEEARKVITQAEEGGEPLRDGLLKFSGWLSQFDRKRLCIWGNGADFDNAILQYVYKVVPVEVPWDFWNNRCFRTLSREFEDYCPKPDRKNVYHNALDDARYQAQWANEILNRITYG